MADSFGLVSAPATLATGGEATGDQALSRILAFLKAYFVTNATASWAQVAPSIPGPVSGLFTNNPKDVVVNDRDLPAFFCWREGEPQDEWVGEDYLLSTSDVRLLWLFPSTAIQPNQQVRDPFRNVMSRLVRLALEWGRTPGWLVAGDTDPLAAVQGSLLYNWINVWSLKAVKMARPEFVETRVDGPPRRYASLEMSLELVENMVFDARAHADLLVSPAADLTINNTFPAVADHVRF